MCFAANYAFSDTIDIDECSSVTHNCDQECHNTIGSFICSCYSGYDLMNMHTCIGKELNEPCTKHVNCSPHNYVYIHNKTYHCFLSLLAIDYMLL